jgi:hypothetical protein
MVEVTAKYDIPEERLNEAIEKKEKVSIWTRIGNKIKAFRDFLKRNIRKFMILSALIFMIFMLFITPNFSYHIVFIIIFSSLMYLIINYLSPMTYIMKVDFKSNDLLLVGISNNRLNDFTIKDVEGKDSCFVYSLGAGKDKVLFVDEIDFANDTITLNPVCSQIAFVKHFRGALTEMREILQKTLNENAHLKMYRSYEAFEIAGRLNDANPLNMIFAKKEAVINQEMLDTDKIESDKNEIGDINP